MVVLILEQETCLVGVIGMALGATGLYLMASMGPETDYAVVTRTLIIVGAGFGTALPAFIIAAQNALPVERAGVALGLSTLRAPLAPRSLRRHWADCWPRASVRQDHRRRHRTRSR